MVLKKKKFRYVLVTTEYRGVYIGELESFDPVGRECVLRQARLAIPWGTTDGVDHLASVGPCPQRKPGTLAYRVWIPALTLVMDCTPEAEAAWRAL